MALVHSEMQLTTTSSRPAARTATPLEQRDVTQLPFPTATVCGHLLWRLYQLGVDHIFGVPGDFALGMFELLQRSPIKYIGTCNELNAGYAADGYARVKGIGACMFTYAVGELSALNAVAGALSERIPMVVIVGVPPTSAYEGKALLHHTMGNYNTPLDIFSKVTCAQALIIEPSMAAEQIDHVLAECLFHCKPVYIAVPSDLTMKPCREIKDRFPYRQMPPSDRDSLIEAIAEACEMINHARHPIVVVDAMVRRCHLENDLIKLIEVAGIPFVSLTMGKAIISERHPQFVGLYAGAHSRENVRTRVENADCIILCGAILSDFNTGGFTANLEKSRIVSLLDNSVSIKHHVYPNVLMGDMIGALTSRLIRRKFADDIYMTPASLACFHRPSNFDDNIVSGAHDIKLKTTRFFDYVSKILPENAVVVAETGESLFSLSETLMPTGTTFISQTFYGSIGFTVGATLGVCAALENSPPRPVFLFVGDGSFQVTCQDISTMIRNGYNPCVFLLNNNGYSVERCIIDGKFNDIQPWKYHLLPLVFGGIAGSDVHTEADLQRAVKAAFDSWHGGLHMIEVHVDSDDTSESMKLAGVSMASSISHGMKQQQRHHKGSAAAPADTAAAFTAAVSPSPLRAQPSV